MEQPSVFPYMTQNPSPCFWTNSPESASPLGPGVKPKIILWGDQSGFRMEVLWKLAWPTLKSPLLFASPPCPPLNLVPTSTLSCLPRICCQTWLFLPGTLDFWVSTLMPISFHLTGFSPAFPSHLDLNLACCREPMSLPTDVILAFPWCSSTPAMAVIRGNQRCPLKCFTYSPPPPPHTQKSLPWFEASLLGYV